MVVYLSNESAQLTEVYFDDLKITVNEHPVIQTDDYYPFGLAHGNGYQRGTAKENQYLYNGKEKIEDLGIEWYDYGARMYLADIGRWSAIDPLTESYLNFSSYVYTLNNPLRYNDIDGLYSTEEWKKENGITDKEVVGIYKKGDGSAIDKLISQPGEQTGNLLINFIKEGTTKGAYDNSSWDFVDIKTAKEIFSEELSVKAAALYINMYKTLGGELNNLALVSHRNSGTDINKNGNDRDDYGAVLGGAVATSHRLNGENTMSVSIVNMIGQVDKGGCVMFMACYAGWTSPAMRKLLDKSGIDPSVSVWMNRDFSAATGTNQTYQEDNVVYDSYHVEFNKDLTSKKRHLYGWVNARNGQKADNIRITSSGKIIPIK